MKKMNMTEWFLTTASRMLDKEIARESSIEYPTAEKCEKDKRLSDRMMILGIILTVSAAAAIIWALVSSSWLPWTIGGITVCTAFLTFLIHSKIDRSGNCIYFRWKEVRDDFKKLLLPILLSEGIDPRQFEKETDDEEKVLNVLNRVILEIRDIILNIEKTLETNDSLLVKFALEREKKIQRKRLKKVCVTLQYLGFNVCDYRQIFETSRQETFLSRSKADRRLHLRKAPLPPPAPKVDRGKLKRLGPPAKAVS